MPGGAAYPAGGMRAIVALLTLRTRARWRVLSPRARSAATQALQACGRLVRTRFMIDWLETPALRRRCHAGLNKSEQSSGAAPGKAGFLRLNWGFAAASR